MTYVILNIILHVTGLFISDDVIDNGSKRRNGENFFLKSVIWQNSFPVPAEYRCASFVLFLEEDKMDTVTKYLYFLLN